MMCEQVHLILNKLPIMKWPFGEDRIPLNGIYILFEEGEESHGGRRIVRVGTHTGKDQLRSRLKQHFINENKDRSIFRKNLGRAILNQSKDPYLQIWELDLTTKKARELHGRKINNNKQKEIESKITNYLRSKFSFVVLRIGDKDERLKLESRIISTISKCKECKPSSNWLGKYSPKEKIKNSGLWLVNEINKEPLKEEDLQKLKNLLRN